MAKSNKRRKSKGNTPKKGNSPKKGNTTPNPKKQKKKNFTQPKTQTHIDYIIKFVLTPKGKEAQRVAQEAADNGHDIPITFVPVGDGIKPKKVSNIHLYEVRPGVIRGQQHSLWFKQHDDPTMARLFVHKIAKDETCFAGWGVEWPKTNGW